MGVRGHVANSSKENAFLWDTCYTETPGYQLHQHQLLNSTIQVFGTDVYW